MMFNIFKKKKDAQEPIFGVPTLKGSEILSKYTEEIDSIYSTLQLSKENYNDSYIAFLEKLAFFIQSIPCPKTTDFDKDFGLFKLCLKCGLNAVKIRRGLVLPPGVRTDLQDEQRSVWSYAIFTAVVINILKQYVLDSEIEVLKDGSKKYKEWDVFDRVPLGKYKAIRYKKSHKKNNIDLHNVISSFLYVELMPRKGYKWLRQYDIVFIEWNALCTSNKSDIKWLANFTDINYVLPSLVNNNENTELIDNENEDEKIEEPKKISSGDGDIKSDDSEVEEKRTVKLNKTTRKKANIQKDLPLKNTPAKENNSDSDLAKINNFVNWLKESYNDGTLIMNQRDSVIHGTEFGVYLISPTVFKKYGKIKKYKDSIIKELEIIIMNDRNYGFVQSDSSSNIHIYTGYGLEIKGFIIPFNVLNMFKKPPINDAISINNSNNDTAIDSF